MSFLGLADLAEQVIATAPDDLDKEAFFNVTALHLAAGAGHLEVVRVLITNNVHVDVNNYAHGTPLIVASANSHVDVVDELLQAGANINEVNTDNRTALLLSIGADNDQIATILVKSEAGVNIKDNYLQSPLHYASNKNKRNIASILIDAGANVTSALTLALLNCFNVYLYSQIEIKCNLGVIEALLEYGAKIKQNQLSAAIISNNIEATKLLLKFGGNVNQIDSSGVSPLVRSLLDYNPSIVDVLLSEPEIDVNCCVPEGEDTCLFPLVRSVLFSNLTLVTELLKRGADPNIEIERCGPLVLQVSLISIDNDTMRADTLSLLLNAGADIKREFYIDDIPYNPLF